MPPYITPIFTFFLGLIAIPITEWLKGFLERRRLLKALKTELEDEILIIDHEFEMLYKCFVDTQSVYETKIGLDKLKTITPDHLKIYSLGKILDNHFETLDTKTRRSIKNIRETCAHLNSLSTDISLHYKNTLSDILNENNQVYRLLTDQKNYLCSILHYRYNINFLIKTLSNENTNLKIFSEVNYYDTVKNQLHEMSKTEYSENIIDS